MRVGFDSYHWNDDAGNPGGGCASGTGFTISWQNGPLGRGKDRNAPNGAFVEDIIDAARDRIAYYQDSRLACDENAKAMEHLTEALACLDARTSRREKAGTEGTHKEN